MNPFEQVHINAQRDTEAKLARCQWSNDVSASTWRELTSDLQHLGIYADDETHNEAIRNLYYAARVESGTYRTVLSELEKQVYDMFKLARKHRGSGWTDNDICKAVSDAILYVTPRQVKSIMNDVEIVQRNMTMLVDTKKQAKILTLEFKQVVKEVLIEEYYDAA